MFSEPNFFHTRISYVLHDFFLFFLSIDDFFPYYYYYYFFGVGKKKQNIILYVKSALHNFVNLRMLHDTFNKYCELYGGIY